ESLRATSSSFSTPNARDMRRSVPNWLMSRACSEPFGRSNRSAGPPAFTVRSTISVISRSGSTSAVTRTSSPSRSSSAIQSRRSFSIALAPVAKPVRQLAERDHRHEYEADAEHDENRLLAFLGGRFGGEQMELREHGENLP